MGDFPPTRHDAASAPAVSGATVAAVPGDAKRTPEQRLAMRQAASLATLAILATLFVAVSAVILLRRHHRRRLESERRGRRPRKSARSDAWREAGRRLQSNDGSDDDTVDIDPDELGPSGPERPGSKGDGP